MRVCMGVCVWSIGKVKPLQGHRQHQLVWSAEVTIVCCTFEGHTRVHMGVWNEGELTDGGGKVVSDQYDHGPVSPNIIWVLTCVFLGGVLGCKSYQKIVKERGNNLIMVVLASKHKIWKLG